MRRRVSWERPPAAAVTIRWIDAESEARKPPPRPLVDARREGWTMRLALVAGGTVYIVAAAAVVWYGQRAAGFDARAAWFLAYSSSLTGVFLIVAFTGRDWRGWAAAGAGWFGGAFVLLVWPLHLTPSAAIRGYRVQHGLCLRCRSLSWHRLPCASLEPLAVGFVPLVGLYFVCAAAEPLAGLVRHQFRRAIHARARRGWQPGRPAGITIAIRQIRRRVRPTFVFSLAAMLIVGLSWSFYSRASAIGGAGRSYRCQRIVDPPHVAALFTPPPSEGSGAHHGRSTALQSVLVCVDGVLPAMAEYGLDIRAARRRCVRLVYGDPVPAATPPGTPPFAGPPHGCCFSACSPRSRFEID